MKKQTGVTMIELVIVIVILLIIVAISISSGARTLDEVNTTGVYEEMNSIKTALNSINVKKGLDESFEIKEGTHYDKPFSEVLSSGVVRSDDLPKEVIENQSEWYVIFGKDNPEAYEESQVVSDGLGLEELKLSYIVNFDTTDVVILYPTKVEGHSVRTYDEVRALVD